MVVITAATAYSGRLLFMSREAGSGSASNSRPAANFHSSDQSFRKPSASRDSYSLWNHSGPVPDGMSSANWREVLSSFHSESLSPGTEIRGSWRTALYHAGIHGGRSAVEELLAKDRTEGDAFARSSEAFAGWAAAEQDAAWEWLVENSDERLRSAFLPRFAPGEAEIREETTMEEFLNLPTEQRNEQAAQVMRDILETGGYDAADSLLDREAAAADGDPNREAVMRTLFDTVAKLREQAVKSGGSVEDAADWLASYTDRSFVRKEHFSFVATELGAREGAESAAAWLASLVTETTAEPVNSALEEHFRQWTARDSVAAGNWLKTQEDHPSYQAMASHVRTGKGNSDPTAAAAEP